MIEYRTERIPRLDIDELTELCAGRVLAKIEIDRALIGDVVRYMSTVVNPALSKREIAKGFIGRLIEVRPTLLSAEIWVSENLGSGFLRGIGEDDEVLFTAHAGKTPDEEYLEELCGPVLEREGD